ncbi:MAG: hypothetical protein HY438_04245, partial [DPANN group archaeon]|nr:hypothetical protein [DPANN group archaeon]
MVKRLIICFLDSEIERTVKLALQEKDSLVIALNGNISEFRKNNIHFKTLDDYSLSDALASLPRTVYEHYIKWGNLEVNGQKLSNILKSEKFDFWQNVQATFCDKLYAHKTPGLKFVLIFREIFSAEKPDEVWSASSSHHASLAAEIVSRHLTIKFRKFNGQLRNPLQPLLAKISHSLVLAHTKKLEYPAMGKTGKKRIMFVLSMPTALQAVYPIIEAAKQKYDVLCVIVEISNNKSLEIQIKKKNLPHVLLQSYYSNYIKERVETIYDFYKKIKI